jgi:Domain of unknown function (DUF222)
MCSSGRESTVFDALDADLDRVCELSFDALTTPERSRILERLERVARRLPVPGNELINQLAGQASPEELGGKLCHALAERLRITAPTGHTMRPRLSDATNSSRIRGLWIPPKNVITPRKVSPKELHAWAASYPPTNRLKVTTAPAHQWPKEHTQAALRSTDSVS